MKYQVIRTETADVGIRKIILYLNNPSYTLKQLPPINSRTREL